MHTCVRCRMLLYVRRPRRVGGRCVAFEAAFMKCSHLPAAKKEPASRAITYLRIVIYTAYRFTVFSYTFGTGHPRFAAVPVACGNVRFPFIF